MQFEKNLAMRTAANLFWFAGSTRRMASWMPATIASRKPSAILLWMDRSLRMKGNTPNGSGKNLNQDALDDKPPPITHTAS
jgi:hypothetical protein